MDRAKQIQIVLIFYSMWVDFLSSWGKLEGASTEKNA